MSIRLRRLSAEYENIKKAFLGHKHIAINVLEGNPPTKYLVKYHLSGLKLDKIRNCPIESHYHEAEIYLPRDYPRQKPICTMRTEIFHPNFGDVICIADYWSAGEKLTDIILQIGQMIQYQNYNTKSPMNAIAARWALDNEIYFPIGNVDLYITDI